MMKKITPLLLFMTLCWSHEIFSQDFNPNIEAADMENYIHYLASDKLKGREPGTDGDKAAAQFIRSKFQEAGLSLLGDDGLQYFDVTTGITLGDHNNLVIGDSIYQLYEQYVPLSFSGSGSVEEKVIFAGYGFSINSDTLSWDDYEGIDANGKWVMVFRTDPDLDNIASAFSEYSTDRYKVMNAMDHGAAGVLLVNTKDFDADDKLEQLKPQGGIASTKIPVIQIKRQISDYLLLETGKSLDELEAFYKENYRATSFSTNKILKGSVDIDPTKATTNNVIALIKGQTDDIIILGAHYDHLGMGGESSRAPGVNAVHYGADDNASGTALLIEMAQKFAIEKPMSTLVFIAFGAEEMGLLGSRYFVENPLIEMNKVKVMFNFDMVGRLNENHSLMIGGTGTALETDSLLSIGFDSTLYKIAKSPGGTGPSDHSSFYSAGIPVLYFTTGVHDQYHTPDDKADLINYAGMEMLGNSIAGLLDYYVDEHQQLSYQESQDPQRQGMRRRMKVTLGIVPDFAEGIEGLGVAGVRSGGPAYNGGMKKGDIIKSIEGKEVTNIYDYMHRMGNYSKDQRITVEVQRGEDKVVLLIQL